MTRSWALVIYYFAAVAVFFAVFYVARLFTRGQRRQWKQRIRRRRACRRIPGDPHHMRWRSGRKTRIR